jgi:hypothetical protein
MAQGVVAYRTFRSTALNSRGESVKKQFKVTGHALIQEGSFMPEHNPAIHLERFSESHVEGVTALLQRPGRDPAGVADAVSVCRDLAPTTDAGK